MIDIEQVRQNPALFKRAIAIKRIPLDLDALLEIDGQRRILVGQVSSLRQERNILSEKIASGNPNKDEHVAKSRLIGEDLNAKESQLSQIEEQFARLMSLVPGLPANDVPEGHSDADNIELRRWGEPAPKSCHKFDHIELAQMHDMVDFPGARNIAGSRAYALTGYGALLEMAVLRFAFDKILTKNFIPVSPPLLVRENAMFGTGYFPLGEENAYEVERDRLFLTGTSEVGTVSVHTNKIFDQKDFPKRYVGFSPCFRREAGAAGKDTKGLYRVHQFQKVEQVVFCANDPEISYHEHLSLLQNAEEIVQALELPYRVVSMCGAELGLGQVRKNDIETWMPSREAYGETHSCSTFHDFQSRRLNIRYIDNEGRKQFAHTLNNTAIATPRILIAILENYQNNDGSIRIPVVLRPYLGGKEVLEFIAKK